MRPEAQAAVSSPRRGGLRGSTPPTLRRSSAAALCLLALAVMGLQGCSMIFVKGPPPPEYARRVAPVRCTTNSLLPLVDGVLAASAAVQFGSMMLSSPAEGQDAASDNFATATPSLVGALIFGASAFIGANRVIQCREYLSTFRHPMQRLPAGLAPDGVEGQEQGVPPGWQTPPGGTRPDASPTSPPQPQPGLGDAPPPAGAFAPPSAPPPSASTPTDAESGPGESR